MRLRRVARLAAAGFGLLSAVAGLALVGLFTSPGNDLVRWVIVRNSDVVVPHGALRLGELRWNGVSHLRLEDVALLDESGAEIISLRALDLQYSLGGLWSRRLDVRALSLDTPVVDLRLQGDTNNLFHALGLDEGPPSPPSTEPWAGLPLGLTLDALRLSDGRVRLVDEDTGETLIGVDGLKLALAGDGAGRVIHLRELDLGGQLSGAVDGPLTLAGDLGFLDGDLQLSGLRLQFVDSVLSLRGGVHDLETIPVLELVLGLERLAAADLNGLLGDEVLACDAGANILANGPLSAIAISADLDAAGAARLDGVLGVGDPLTWRFTLETEGLDLDRLLVAVTEPTHLDGRYFVDGRGVSWPDDLSGAVEVDGRDQVFWGEPARDLRLRAHVAGGHVTVDALEGRAAVGSVALAGEVDVPGGTVVARGLVSLPQLAALERYGVTGAAGAARYRGGARVDWSGDAVDVALDGDLSGTGLSYEGLVIDELTGPVRLGVRGSDVSGDGGVAISGFHGAGVALESAVLNWRLNTDASGLSATSTVAIYGLDGPALGDSATGVGEVSGAVSFSQPTSGARTASVALHVDAAKLTPGRQVAGPIAANLSGDRLEMSVDLSDAAGPVVRVAGTGDLATGVWTLPDLVVAPDAAVVWRGEGTQRFTLAANGARDLRLVIGSEAGKLSVEGQALLDAPDLRFAVEDLDLAYLSSMDELFLGADEADALAGHLSASGSLGVEGDFPSLVLDSSLVGLDLPGGPQGVDAQLSVREANRDVVLEAQVSHDDEIWARLGAAVPIRLTSWQGGRDPQDIGLDCDRDISARLLLGPLDDAALGQILVEDQLGLSALSADLSLAGGACDPEISATAAAIEQMDEVGRKLRVDLQATRDGRDLVLSGTVEEDAVRRLRLDGSAQTNLGGVLDWALAGGEKPDLGETKTWVQDLSISAQTMSLPLEALTALLGLPNVLGGDLGAAFSVAGQVDRPSALGAMVVSGGRIGAADLDSGQIMLVPADKGYSLILALDFAGPGSLNIDGFIPFSFDPAADPSAPPVGLLDQEGLALKVSGEGLPLEALMGSVPGLVSADGLLRLSGDVGGTLGAPKPHLELDISGAHATLADTGVAYTIEDAAIAITTDRIGIDRLDLETRPRYGGALRRGKLRIAGDVGLVAYTPNSFDLALKMDEFWATATTEYQIALTGDVGVVGTWPDLAISRLENGRDITLASGRITLGRDFFLDDASMELVPEIKVTRSDSKELVREVKVPPEWEGFSLNLGLDLSRSLALSVEMPTEASYGAQFADLSSVKLAADFDGNLTVTGTIGAPRLSGTVETVRGTANLLGVSFALDPEGTISFVGDDIANPILELTAVRQTGSYGDVKVVISGDVNHVGIDYRSEDYPDPADVMSLLLFGKPTSEMSDSEGETGALVMGMALSSVTDSVEKLVGTNTVDQFEIDPSSGAVRVGKALSDKLFLTLTISPLAEETDNRTQATVEWLIQRRLYAEFITGDRGQSSADLYWRWRF